MPPTLDHALSLHRAGHLAEAESLYRQLLENDSNNPSLLHLLGLVRHQLADHTAAAELISRAIGLNPSIPQFHYNLGNVHRAAKRHELAAASYQSALHLNPNYVEALDNLAGECLALRRHADAIRLARQSLSIRPQNAAAALTLGAALADEGRDERAAEQALRHALSLDPNSPGALANLALLLSKSGRLDEASGLARLAVAGLAHKHPQAANVLSTAAQVLQLQGWIRETVPLLRRAVELDPADPVIHSNLLYALWFHPDESIENLYAEHLRCGARHADPKTPATPVFPQVPASDRRLRVGYVSREFRVDPVDGRFIEPVLIHHDRDRFEVFCYCDATSPSPLIERLRKHRVQWRDTHALDHTCFADVVRTDRIDVLIDLTWHLAGNRQPAFALRPAPVQITWVGQPTTTGVCAMDYLITDVHLDPPGLARPIHHTEKFLHLPRSYSSFLISHETTPPVNPLPALASGHFTLGSTHTHAKLNERVLKLWAQVMRRLPSSRLLLRLSGGDEHNRSARFLYVDCGIPNDRLEIVGRAPSGEHLNLYHRIDLCLDAFPYGGYTNSLEALWMGVPTLTLAGDTACSRFGVSLLHNVGLDEFIATTPEEFLAIATRLAGDLPRLSEIRATLRERMMTSPLTDHAGVTRDLESLYRIAWRNWCDSQKGERGSARADFPH